MRRLPLQIQKQFTEHHVRLSRIALPLNIFSFLEFDDARQTSL
jgi:hypothetical protein